MKNTLLAGSVALSVVMFGYSFATSVTHFYILAFFNGIFANALSFMVIGILVGAWFADGKGLAPFTSAKKEKNAADKPRFDLTLREVFRTSRFWLLAAAFLLISSFVAATNTHSTPFLGDLGYPSETVTALGSSFSVPLMGAVYDSTQSYDLAWSSCSA